MSTLAAVFAEVATKNAPIDSAFNGVAAIHKVRFPIVAVWTTAACSESEKGSEAAMGQTKPFPLPNCCSR
eukprot:2250533-Amphidinium_carterae.1